MQDRTRPHPEPGPDSGPTQEVQVNAPLDGPIRNWPDGVQAAP